MTVYLKADRRRITDIKSLIFLIRIYYAGNVIKQLVSIKLVAGMIEDKKLGGSGMTKKNRIRVY